MEKRTTFHIHLHTSSGQENKIKWNLKKKGNESEEEYHRGMSSRHELQEHEY